MSSVRQKKAEARNNIQLLAALKKLHAARIRCLSSESASFSCSDPSLSGFDKIIGWFQNKINLVIRSLLPLPSGKQSQVLPSFSDKLTTLWNSHLKEYTVEENGLNVMLKHSNLTDGITWDLNRDTESYTRLKRNFTKWLKLIFGTTDIQEGLFYTSFQDFAQIRFVNFYPLCEWIEEWFTAKNLFTCLSTILAKNGINLFAVIGIQMHPKFLLDGSCQSNPTVTAMILGLNLFKTEALINKQ